MSERADIVSEVAAAVGLAEGEAGVHSVVRTVARFEPVAVRKVSRATELPVPIVSAICGELRKRGVVSTRRPVRLTRLGRELFDAARHPDFSCADCEGRGLAVPPSLAPVARELARIAAAAPARRVELDQSHCTVDTKIRRVLTMADAGALDGKRMLVLGDDDLTSVAIRLVAKRLGATIGGLEVVDIDPDVCAFVARFGVESSVHDLREPLPAKLRGAADTVFTDPPYTVAGATLFLSRAAEAAAGPGRDVFLALGARRPEESLGVQRAIAEMGFTVRRLVPNFNEYLGAGVLAGTSHLYQLTTTKELRPLVEGRYDGPLYTGDVRDPGRRFKCFRCGTVQRVGRGEAWPTVSALKRDGCPRCGGTSFVPLARANGYDARATSTSS